MSMLYPVQSICLNRLIPSEQRATLISVDSMLFSIVMIVLFPAAGPCKILPWKTDGVRSKKRL